MSTVMPKRAFFFRALASGLFSTLLCVLLVSASAEAKISLEVQGEKAASRVKAGKKKVAKVARPPTPDPALVADQAMREGRGAYATGDYARAARAFERVPTTTPEFLRTREELAWSYLRAGEFSRLRGLLPHLNSELVPLRWRLEGRVLSSMVYLRDCQYEQVQEEIKAFQREMLALTRRVESKASSGRHAGYWADLKSEIQEAVFKMKFVRVELRSRLVLLSREQAVDVPPSTRLENEKIAANAQVYPVTEEFWSDELFKARGVAESSCAQVHKLRAGVKATAADKATR